MKQLETERLILRQWKLDDLDNFYENSKNSKVGPMAGWKPHESREESLSLLKMFIEADETWAITLKKNGRVIGSVGLHEDSKRNLGKDRARMLGYVLAEPYWGRGYMPEACKAVLSFAFEELKLEIMSVNHFDFNEQSKSVIKKLGFKYEGTLRRGYKRYDGKVFDELCYSMTSSEYNAKSKTVDYRFSTVGMSRETAERFLSWHYEVPFDIYNCPDSEYSVTLEAILNRTGIRDYYAVYDEIGDLAGVYVYYKDASDKRLFIPLFSPNRGDRRYLSSFIKTGAELCRRHYAYNGDILMPVPISAVETLGIAENLGFVASEDKKELVHGKLAERRYMLLRGEA